MTAERTQAERDAEARAIGFIAAEDEVTQAERRGYCRGWDAAVTQSRATKALERIADAESGPWGQIAGDALREIGAR